MITIPIYNVSLLIGTWMSIGMGKEGDGYAVARHGQCSGSGSLRPCVYSRIRRTVSMSDVR
ncbi:hypothetical protein X946_3568 [Burkholderia sp. ABCPW 111]|nr:hypothetical protein X946_3568 [Burkholderia sp. ABCPW 111]